MKEKFLNYMGTPGNYQFSRPMPNPSNLRGNPDTFSWAMNKGGDGLNASRIGSNYSHFTGEVQDDAWNYGRFSNQDGEGDIQTDMGDVVVDGNADSGPKWWQVGQWNIWQGNNSNTTPLTEQQQADKVANRNEFWNNIFSGVNTSLASFQSGSQTGLSYSNPYQTNNPANPGDSGPGGENTTTIITQPNEAGMSTSNTILLVVGVGLGVGLLVWGLSGSKGGGSSKEPEFMKD